MKEMEIKEHTTYDGYTYYSCKEIGFSSPNKESLVKEIEWDNLNNK
jgi:hypothetical protein